MIDFDVLSRYQLICNAAKAEDSNQQVGENIHALGQLIHHDLTALARRGSPDHFADMLRDIQNEFQRFCEFCEFPDLAQKQIIGIGGKFSSGKSTLINTLIGKKKLVAEIDPTTSMPTYLLKGAQDTICGLNIFGNKVELSQDEFLSFTHEEEEKYGSKIGNLLTTTFVQDSEFSWQNIALLDTPGYTKHENEAWHERTDANIARSQLNSAQFIIWLISAEDGCITEDDIQFLSNLRTEIPKLVLVNKSDTKTESEIKDIVALVRKTLGDRHLPVDDVIAVSRNTKRYPLDKVHQWLDKCNQQQRSIPFARNFKHLLHPYSTFFTQEDRSARESLHKLNRVLTLMESNAGKEDLQLLRQRSQNALSHISQLQEDFQQWQIRFFKTLKSIGDQVGITLPEPDELSFIDNTETNLSQLLSTLRETHGREKIDVSLIIHDLQAAYPIQAPFDTELPSHSIANEDRLLREYYAVLLAVILLQDGKVSQIEQQVFSLLLSSLNLSGKEAQFLEEASALTIEKLQFILSSFAHQETIQTAWLLDALVLMRIDSPLNDISITTIGEMCSAFQFPVRKLALLSKITLIILHIYEINSETRAHLRAIVENPAFPFLSTYQPIINQLF